MANLSSTSSSLTVEGTNAMTRLERIQVLNAEGQIEEYFQDVDTGEAYSIEEGEKLMLHESMVELANQRNRLIDWQG
jgi:hypothetical protein